MPIVQRVTASMREVKPPQQGARCPICTSNYDAAPTYQITLVDSVSDLQWDVVGHRWCIAKQLLQWFGNVKVEGMEE